MEEFEEDEDVEFEDESQPDLLEMIEEKLQDPTSAHDLYGLVLGLRNVATLGYRERLELWRPKAAGLVMSIMMDDRQSVRIRELCWNIFYDSMQLPDHRLHPSFESKDTFEFGITAGIVEALEKELSREELNMNIVDGALVLLSRLALMERVANMIVGRGFIAMLVRIVENDFMGNASLRSLICLTNFAIHQTTHEEMIQAQCLRICSQFLHFLSSSDEHELDFGLSASFLICRIHGEDEVGPGSNVIHQNRILLDRLEWLLRQVLYAGPHGIVLNSMWDPANIVLDVSILARADRSKPMLVRFIPLLVRGLTMYSRTNVRLNKYTMQTFMELYHDPGCLGLMKQNKDSLVNELSSILESPRCDLETYQSASFLLHTLDFADPSPSHFSRLRTVVCTKLVAWFPSLAAWLDNQQSTSEQG